VILLFSLLMIFVVAYFLFFCSTSKLCKLLFYLCVIILLPHGLSIKSEGHGEQVQSVRELLVAENS
jgi:Ca2+/Na+ antiporter